MNKSYCLLAVCVLAFSGCCQGHKAKPIQIKNDVTVPMPTTAPAGGTAASPSAIPTTATTRQIIGEIGTIDQRIASAQAEVDQKLKGINLLFDPAVRDANAAEVLPALRNLVDLFQLKIENEQDPDLEKRRINLMGVMVLLGDEQAEKQLQAIADGQDKGRALSARLSRLTGLWWRNNSQPAGQEEIIKELTTIAMSDPANDEIFLSMYGMAGFGAANATITTKLEQVIRNSCTGKEATLWKHRPAVGSIVQFKGVTLDGTPFDTTQQMGKVVVLNIWATWCPYSRAELANISKQYASEKDHGLLVVSIMADDTAEAFNAFQKNHPEVTWPTILVSQDVKQNFFGTDSVPIKCILGPDGKLAVPIQGYSDAELNKTVASLLAKVQTPLDK